MSMRTRKRGTSAQVGKVFPVNTLHGVEYDEPVMKVMEIKRTKEVPSVSELFANGKSIREVSRDLNIPLDDSLRFYVRFRQIIDEPITMEHYRQLRRDLGLRVPSEQELLSAKNLPFKYYYVTKTGQTKLAETTPFTFRGREARYRQRAKGVVNQ